MLVPRLAMTVLRLPLLTLGEVTLDETVPQRPPSSRRRLRLLPRRSFSTLRKRCARGSLHGPCTCRTRRREGGRPVSEAQAASGAARVLPLVPLVLRRLCLLKIRQTLYLPLLQMAVSAGKQASKVTPRQRATSRRALLARWCAVQMRTTLVLCRHRPTRLHLRQVQGWLRVPCLRRPCLWLLFARAPTLPAFVILLVALRFTSLTRAPLATSLSAGATTRECVSSHTKSPLICLRFVNS